MSNFQKVREFLLSLEVKITLENEAEELLVIDNENEGIVGMIVDCEDPILIIEQFIFNLKKDDPSLLKRLLQMNREFVHGALVLDEAGKKVIYRDTLQIDHLDFNELEASIKSLSLFLGEHAKELLEMSKGKSCCT